MKTGKIILIISALVIIVGVVIFAFTLRKLVNTERAKAGLPLTYSMLPAGEFDRLILSAHLDVKIRQGKSCLVEYASVPDSVRPLVTNQNGTLHFRSDSADMTGDQKLLPVRITMPVLYEITASNGTTVHLGFFQSDSVKVTLGEGCKFSGSNNTLKHVSFKTAGDAFIDITSTF